MSLGWKGGEGDKCTRLDSGMMLDFVSWTSAQSGPQLARFCCCMRVYICGCAIMYVHEAGNNPLDGGTREAFEKLTPCGWLRSV